MRLMKPNVKVGIIGRADNTGLGVETWEFCRHFPGAKVMIVSFAFIKEFEQIYKLHLERFYKPEVVSGIPSEHELRIFLSNVDVLFTIETPYNPKTYEIAREMGVKTVLRVNYEWLEHRSRPDLYIAPSLYHFDEIPEPKVYLPFPINREVLPFKLRKKAKKFIHIAGNMKAGYDRNGTDAFLEAIPHIKSNIEIIIKSQVPIECRDPRVRVDVCDHENYWEIWEDADVLVSPRRYAGQSLPLNEALSLGMAVVMTDMAPQNEFLPNDFLIPATHKKPLMIKQNIEIAEINPKDIAAKIDEWAGKDIKKYSQISDNIASAWSWEALKSKYQQLFTNLCS